MHYQCCQIKGEGPHFHSKPHPTIFWLILHFGTRKGITSSTPCPWAVPLIVQGKEWAGGREGEDCKREGVAEERERRRTHPLRCLHRVPPDLRAISQSLGMHSEFVDRKEKSEPVFWGTHPRHF